MEDNLNQHTIIIVKQFDTTYDVIIERSDLDVREMLTEYKKLLLSLGYQEESINKHLTTNHKKQRVMKEYKSDNCHVKLGDCVELIKELPDDYRLPTDVLPGLTFDSLHHQLRKLYMFRIGDSTAEKLTDRKQQELLFQMLNALEPREAEIILGIFQKDQHIRGLDYKFVKEAFPQMLP